MKSYLIKQVVEYSKLIKASSRQEAIDNFDETNADTRLVKLTAKVYLVGNSIKRPK